MTNFKTNLPEMFEFKLNDRGGQCECLPAVYPRSTDPMFYPVCANINHIAAAIVHLSPEAFRDVSVVAFCTYLDVLFSRDFHDIRRAQLMYGDCELSATRHAHDYRCSEETRKQLVKIACAFATVAVPAMTACPYIAETHSIDETEADACMFYAHICNSIFELLAEKEASND